MRLSCALAAIAGVAACRAGPTDSSASQPSASSPLGAPAESALVEVDVVPDGCDYLVVAGKHIVPRDKSQVPFKRTPEGDTISGSYCYRGVDLTDADAVSRLKCKSHGSGTSVTFECPGVRVTYLGLLDEPHRIEVVDLP